MYQSIRTLLGREAAGGIVTLRGWSGHWLVAFYLMIFFMGPYFYVFLVVLDSLMDFRGRIRPKAT